ncbi:conserved hypothetical protein, partial [Ricinus communis]
MPGHFAVNAYVERIAALQSIGQLDQERPHAFAAGTGQALVRPAQHQPRPVIDAGRQEWSGDLPAA